MEITEGLQGGETVVVEGNFSLPDGTKVEIAKEEEKKEEDEKSKEKKWHSNYFPFDICHLAISYLRFSLVPCRQFQWQMKNVKW